MVTKTNPGGEILKSARLILNDEEAAALLDDLNGLSPAKKVENVQRLRIGLSRAAQAIAERDELVKKARAAAALAGGATAAAAGVAGLVRKSTSPTLEKAAALIESQAAEIAELRAANASWKAEFGKVEKAVEKFQADAATVAADVTAIVKASTEEVAAVKKAYAEGMDAIQKSVEEFGKTAAWSTPIGSRRDASLELDVFMKAPQKAAREFNSKTAIAALEKALASTTSEPTQDHLRKEIALLKAQ